jgi:hypothetical protein
MKTDTTKHVRACHPEVTEDDLKKMISHQKRRTQKELHDLYAPVII